MTDINALITDIFEIEEYIEKIKTDGRLSAKREELKAAILALPVHSVRVGGIVAKVSERCGRQKVDFDKLKELVHANTYRAVVSEGKPSTVLEVGKPKRK